MTPIASILDRSAQGSRGESESLATAASSFPTVYGLGPSMLRCFASSRCVFRSAIVRSSFASRYIFIIPMGIA